MKTAMMPRLALLFFLQSAVAQDSDCFVPGECQQSNLLFSTATSGPDECLDYCVGYTGCTNFTFYDTGICNIYANCVDLSTDFCSDTCISGNVNCAKPSCWEKGQCIDAVLATQFVSSRDDCLFACQGDDRCTWYSYIYNTRICNLMDGCKSVDASCTNCVHGQKECTPELAGSSRILVVGGCCGDQTAVELLDLSDVRTVCDEPASLPEGLYGAIGAYFDGRPIICGGAGGINTCLEYSQEEDKWTIFPEIMSAERYRFAGSLLQENEFILAGGNTDESDTSVDLLRIGDGFIPTNIELPYPVWGHCLIKVDEERLFLAGGYDQELGDYSSNAYLFNFIEDTWLQLPNMPQAKGYLSCGTSSASGALEVIVAGGLDGPSYLSSTHILNLDTLEWRTGNDLPEPRAGGAAVQLTRDRFVIVGGYDGGSDVDTIVEYDGSTGNWVTIGKELAEPKELVAAMLVPSNFGNCYVP